MRTFIGGLGIGALIGMTIAPASGAETRNGFRRRFRQFREQLGMAGKRATIRARRARQLAPRLSPRPKRLSPPPRRTPLSFINYAPRKELMAVKGIGEVLAEKIIKGRPYRSESAVLEDHNLPPSILDLVKDDISERKAG